ncbi:uncharacterized protein IL334_004632 [Kwoniella shivajii]|uniref:Uncharacterized protein n=1 Tax=Kwoniella shivajii TaxID=564305 RepID=A0ABZ1D0W8_9TREE|nr:hypothetical protein IL334_004632 [Kwoniella shivajii]
MNPPTPLSSLTDPASLSKITILLVPVHQPSSPIPQNIYTSYSSFIKRYQTLRGDDLSRPLQSRSRTPTGSADLPPNPRLRFFPPSTGNSISVSRGSTTNQLHLTYTGNAPPRHTYPLSLLRMAGFPLIVLGIAVDPAESQSGESEGYQLDLDEEENGDIGNSTSSSQIPTLYSDRASSSSTSHNPEQSFDESISSVFPPTSPFPLVKRLLVVPNQLPRSPSSPRKQNSPPTYEGRGKGKDKGYMRYAPEDGVESWIGRVLGEVVGELLGELGEIATALETPAGMRTLSATLLPSLTSTLPHPGLDNMISSHRSSTPNEYPSRPSSSTPVGLPHSQSVSSLEQPSGMGISLTRALTPGGRPTSIQPPSLPPLQTNSISPAPQSQPAASSNPFRRSTAISSPFTRTSSATSAPSSSTSVPQLSTTKYTNAALSGVAGGRLMKLLGDMYLLAGLYGDAIKCYEEGAERCRSVGDVLWEGMAREGRAVAGIGEAWEGRDGSNMVQPFPSSPIPVEILSHYLSAQACLARSPLPYPPTILSPSPLAVSGSISFSAPSNTSPSSVGTGEGLLAYLHTSLSLKISHFLLLIWASGGWGSIALSSLMIHNLPRSFIAPLQPHEMPDAVLRRKRNRSLLLLSTTSQISKQSILAHAEDALSPYHRAMTKTEQLVVHNEFIWLARWLNLPRKEASVTREVMKRLAMLVVEGREETRKLNGAGFNSKRPKSPPRGSLDSALAIENRSDAEAASASAAVGLGLGLSVPNQTVAVRRKESIEGNNGIKILFERVAGILGIDLLTLNNADRNQSGHRHTESAINLSTEVEIRENLKFGWPELQVEFIKEGIAITEALPDHPSIIRLCLSALRNLSGYLNPQSQAVLNRMYPTSLATCRRRGIDIGQIPWWVGGKLVLSVEIASLPPNKFPIEHSKDEIIVKEGKKDPFLYNPRLKAAEAGKTILVANEQVDIFVTVRNPFAFDLEVQDLSILTTGVPFITSPLPLTLPATSVQTVRVTGHSPVPGSMSVKGISIRLTDGSSTEILIPIIDSKEKDKRDKRKSRLKADLSKIKRQGIDARYALIEKSKDAQRDSIEEGGKWLECKVVEELPLAWIKRTSLTHGTVMLYHGESSIIRITIVNSSSVPIDFIKLTFDDSTSRDSQAIIQEGELTPEQAYEIEFDQLNKPVFTWEKEHHDQIDIQPGGRMNINVKCLGKVGCTDGMIRIDYGNLNQRIRARSLSINDSGSSQIEGDGDLSKTFYTRQITFPVLFTVYHTIDCHSLDLIRLGSSDVSPVALNNVKINGLLRPRLERLPSTSAVSEECLRNILNDENDDDHCLLALSVRNVYGVPFGVSLQRKGDEAVECTRLVPPGATERMILPLPRKSISQSLLSRPIPSLSSKQYIVDKEKKSDDRLKKERELFWYREELLNSIKAIWTEPGSNRSGELNLRTQYLSSSLLDIIRSDQIEIKLALKGLKESGVVGPMEFIDVQVEVTNKLERPFRPYLHVSPLPSSPTDQSWTQPIYNQRHSIQAMNTSSMNTNANTPKNVLFDGLSSAPLPLLQPDETITYNIGLTFLCLGKYGLRAAVEEIQDEAVNKQVGIQGHDDIDVEKKIWFSPVLNVDVR